MEAIICKRKITEKQAEHLNKQFIDEHWIDQLIINDTDGYDSHGNLLFKLRCGAIPQDVLSLGYENFKDSIELTEGRGAASGSSGKRVLKDGTVSKITVGVPVTSGNVGYMDRNAMVRYCRLTQFARDHFDQFTAGIPFVQHIDSLYATLCPDQYKLQRAIADATNRNYVIPGTSFTTVTVNKNFRTAAHQDSGDFMHGMGNLCVYRQGHFEGCYFVLPEYGVGFDLQNGDMLFVDVHKYHGNTAFKNADPDYLRISFVMYYRENMIACKQPSEELAHVKHVTGNYFKL